jgi:fluoroquinolone resistance protein
MTTNYIVEQSFDGIDFTQQPMVIGEYERCRFLKCNFAEAGLSGAVFIECQFIDCDLSMARIANASFREVIFKGCKQLGLRFDQCNKMLFSVAFENCVLNFSSFYKLKLKSTKFINCSLHEVEFAEADLSFIDFSGGDLTRAVFENTNLTGADFRRAHGYIIDPEKNEMKKARFSIEGLPGLLSKHNLNIE